jgi:hypothetical protein
MSRAGREYRCLPGETQRGAQTISTVSPQTVGSPASAGGLVNIPFVAKNAKASQTGVMGMGAAQNGDVSFAARPRLSIRPRRRGATPGERRSASSTAESPVTGGAEWLVTNDSNRRAEIVARDRSRLSLSPLTTLRLPGELVERFALDHWPDLLILESPDSAADAARQAARDSRRLRSFLGWARSFGGEQLYLWASIILGAVLPIAVIFLAADGLNLLHLLSSAAARRALPPNPITQHDVVVTMIGRVMQIFFVAIAALLPALLYFLFDREHLDTLRQRFIRQIMRFDPGVRYGREVKAKYGNQMEEAYGRDAEGRLLPGRRSPLLLATLVLSLGWTFTLLHGDVLIVRERGIAALFEPRQTAVSFAFIGAYFYGINAVLRGYIRKDLRPKTYSALTVRIFIVVLLAWVLEVVWHSNNDSNLFAVAFLAGIVPETALVLIQETVRGAVGNRFPGIDEDPDQLTKLEGIDLYDRARLFDEGVTNVESLAHHDVVELMLQTRIPVPRLVDWVDQAILYLHAGPRSADQGSRAQCLIALRNYGIRTATDLDNAFAGATERNELGALRAILNPSPKDTPARLQVMKDALEDEEWMCNIRAWHQAGITPPKPICLRVPSNVSTGAVPEPAK